MRSRGSSQGEEGFTLLEMLVTLAVMAFISTMLIGGVVSLRHITQGLVADSSADTEIASAQNILRARIEGLRAVTRLDRATPILDIYGDDQRFSFYAPPLQGDSVGGLQAFRLLRTATGDLVLFSAPSLTEDLDLRSPDIAGWKRTKLLSGVDQLSISYFGKSGGSVARWQSFWQESTQPPLLIRISARLTDGPHRLWPDLVVRPNVTLNLACQMDAVTGRCNQELGQ